MYQRHRAFFSYYIISYMKKSVSVVVFVASLLQPCRSLFQPNKKTRCLYSTLVSIIHKANALSRPPISKWWWYKLYPFFFPWSSLRRVPFIPRPLFPVNPFLFYSSTVQVVQRHFLHLQSSCHQTKDYNHPHHVTTRKDPRRNNPLLDFSQPARRIPTTVAKTLALSLTLSIHRM